MKKLLALLLAFIIIACCGCMENKPLNKDNDTVRLYIDPYTGVNYLIYTDSCRGGMTVRYNSDGTIMVGEH